MRMCAALRLFVCPPSQNSDGLRDPAEGARSDRITRRVAWMRPCARVLTIVLPLSGAAAPIKTRRFLPRNARRKIESDARMLRASVIGKSVTGQARFPFFPVRVRVSE